MARSSTEPRSASLDEAAAGSYSVRMREAHDPQRPAVGSNEAAERLGKSRQTIVKEIVQGILDGYGIPAEARTRWFVWRDVVEAREAERAGVGEELARLRSRNRELEDAMATLLDAIEKRRNADELMRQSRDLDRQSKERAEKAWANLSEVAATFEAFLGRQMVPDSVEDT